MQDDEQSPVINKITTIALTLFIVSWTLIESINNFTIILCGLVWIISKGYRKMRLNNFFVLWSVFFCLVFFVSTFYSDNKDEALAATGRKLLLPVIFTIFPFLISKVKGVFLFRVYIITWVLTSLHSLIYTFLKHGIDYNNISYFSWLLPKATSLDSIYLGLFVAFALIVLLSDIQANSFFGNKFVTIFLVLYFIFYLVLISARVSFFATVFVIVLFPVFSFPSWSKKAVSIYAIVVIGLSTTITMASPFLREKMVRLIDKKDPRFFEFRAGMEVISENLLTGVGVGDVQSHLNVVYHKNGFQQGIDEDLNVHNEFLHDTMTVGIIGFLLVVTVAMACFSSIFRTRDFLQFGFTALFFSCCLAEVVMNRQKGITFFAFFISMLFIVPADEKNTSR